MNGFFINKPETQRRSVNFLYDTTPSIHHQYNFSIAKKFLLNKVVLDIGCWTGIFERVAVGKCKSITGIDPKKEAIDFAKKSVKGAKFAVGNALKLDFSKNSFDAVTLLDVIEHVPVGTEKKALREIHRVLKNHGHLVLVTPSKHLISILLDPAYFLIKHRHYSVKNLTTLLSQTGFKIVDLKKTGGLARLITYNLELVLKHLFGKKLNPPKWVNNAIINEYKNGGFAQIHLVAEKI